MPEFRIVCFANSQKFGGRCLAGKVIDEFGNIKNWLRPVSERENEELSDSERQFHNGDEPMTMDLMFVTVTRHKPVSHQSENWLIDPTQPPRKIGKLPINAIHHFIDDVSDLWTNGFHSATGENDRIPEELISNSRNSLFLIKANNVVIKRGYSFGKSNLSAKFVLNEVSYSLKVTDPLFEKNMRDNQIKECIIDTCCLTISLAERVYNGFYYKLVAGVIPISGVKIGNAN